MYEVFEHSPEGFPINGSSALQALSALDNFQEPTTQAVTLSN